METFHKKKFIVGFVLVMSAVIILLCCFLSWYEMRVTTVDVTGITKLSLDEVTLNLDNAYYQTNAWGGTEIKVDGWCAIAGKETNPISIHVLLKDINKNIYYKLPTSIVKRDDVTSYMNDSIDYSNSGFNASLNYSGLNFGSMTYEVVLLYEVGGDVYLIPSGRIM